jgi:hypothetical protein
MTTEHTPGPWRVNDERAIEAFFEGEWVQICAMNRSRWSMPEQDKNIRLSASLAADAALIARAPELLAENSDLQSRLQAAEQRVGELRQLLQRCEDVIGIQNCDECEHSLVLHFDRYGCEYERGDHLEQDVGWVAGGPCGCKAENLSADGNDAFLLLRDIRQLRILAEAEKALAAKAK